VSDLVLKKTTEKKNGPVRKKIQSGERKKAGQEKAPSSPAPLNPPGPSRQVQFYQLLVAARKQWFMEALSEALQKSDPNKIKEQIIKYVPAEGQKTLASAGIRDEHVFPLPEVIEAKPSLIGYYRLLLVRSSPKSVLQGSNGYGRLKDDGRVRRHLTQAEAANS
jgi:hypothetical protein